MQKINTTWEMRAVPFSASYTLEFALQLKKKHGKTSVWVVEMFRDIPVAVIEYTFTNKQYTEQHSGTDCTEETYIIITILKLTNEHII
jgi:hypothetical protein